MGSILKEFEELEEDQEEELKKLLDKEKENKKKQEANGNQMNRYRKDVETNTADRERKIKEKKENLGEKRVPKSIKFFKVMIGIVFIFIIVLSGFSLRFKSNF